MQCITPYERSRQYLICLDIYQRNVKLSLKTGKASNLISAYAESLGVVCSFVLKLNYRPLRTYYSWCLL